MTWGMLFDGPAAIYHQHMASDELGFVRSKIDRSGGDILRPADTTPGGHVQHLLAQFWNVQTPACHRRLNHAGADRVYPDMVGCVIQRQRTSERDNSALRGVISSPCGEGHEPGSRRNIDNRTTSLCQHLPNGGTGDPKHAADI